MCWGSCRTLGKQNLLCTSQTPALVDSSHRMPVSCTGTTVTAILSIGPLLTVANTGDSSAILDTGSSTLEMTKSHRIHDSLEEQTRLKSAGCYLAPLGFHLQGPAKPHELGVGPMRLWPGGLCVSRSVGDLDAGSEVIPIPHIRQVGEARTGQAMCLDPDMCPEM